MSRPFPIVAALGTTQTLAWASSYYLPAVLAEPIARDLGISNTWVFAVFSGSLLISGLLGPRVGRQIDLIGGRQVLSASNILFAVGLTLLGFAHSFAMLTVAWLVLGVGMGLGLYDAAFGALGRIFGQNARRSISGITLFAGFASTVGWPLTSWGLETIGWRDTCFAWAIAHIVIGLPLNLIFLPSVKNAPREAAAPVKVHVPMDRTMILLAFAFAAVWTVTGAMAAHLPRILESAGATHVQAIAAGALFGPAQVFARAVEVGLLNRFHPMLSTRFAALMHPFGVGLLFSFGSGAAAAFAICFGIGNGIITIARGTLPLAIFGAENYGYRLGLLGAPARIAQATAPLLFSFLIDGMGSQVLIVSTVLCLLAFAALCLISGNNRQDHS